MSWIGTGGGAIATANVVVVLRACASLTVATMFLLPTGPITADASEKTRSPAVTSPCVPSSKNGCVAAPPIAERSAVTLRFVLSGKRPGVTVTFRREMSPLSRLPGTAWPVPDGASPWMFRGIGAPATKSALLSSVS